MNTHDRTGNELGDRLKKGPAPEMVEHFISEHLVSDSGFFDAQMQINRAHVVMLYERGIITHGEAATLLDTFADMMAEGVEGLTLDEKLGDLYMNIEAEVIRRAGPDIGGRMHTGRSRNDIEGAMLRMDLRSGVNDIVSALVALQETILERAQEHAATVMPGFTHTQPAQPITFGHYLLANAAAFQRAIERLEGTYDRVNRSPMGAAALAGTSFPVDRQRMADLLGFDRIELNTLDAISSRDTAIEVVADLAILMTTMSRLATDFTLWGNWIYGTLELDDSFASVSSIMPQKKNNVSVETIRANTGMVFGDLMATLSVLRAIPWGMHRDLTFIDETTGSAIKRASGMLAILDGVLRTVQCNADVMLSRAADGFATATDLADLLVRERGLPFRSAYTVVGALVNQAVGEGLDVRSVTPELVDDVALETLGKPLGLSEDQVRKALDPVGAVESRNNPGGPAPESTAAALEQLRSQVKPARERLAGRERELAKARKRLDRAVEALRQGS